MRVGLTPSELVDILAGLIRDESGTVWLDIPDACVDNHGQSLFGVDVLPDDRFRFSGQIYSLSDSPTQWELLSAIIDFGGIATHADLGERIWGDDTAPGGRIRKLVSDMNQSFRAMCVPLRVTNRRQRVVLQQVAPGNEMGNAK